MTIEPGQEWGSEVDGPVDARRASTDADVAAGLVAVPRRPVEAVGGDLWRTIGAPPPGRDATRRRRYPVDLVEVDVDGLEEPRMAAAHVVARRGWTAGGWLRGEVLVVMNAEFLGDWDVAPRGHPNDGRVETFHLDPGLGVRQRLAIHRRLATASHLPHPAITVRPVRERSWRFERPLEVWIDGVHVGRSAALSIVVRPDAGSIVV